MLRLRPTASLALLALAACAAARVPTDLAALMADAPVDAPTRLWLDGDRITAAAVAVGPGVLPPEVRVTADAVAPRGELVFQGREWSGRGEGFRIEKRYQDVGAEHMRSVLIGADGNVLERAHTVPIAKVPQHVLVAALRVGPDVVEARIVSGPTQEEYWTCVCRNRIGRTFAADIDLDGRLLRSRRRVDARVEL